MFYRELEKGHACAVIDEIIENTESADDTMRFIELFINNLITVEEIEMILF